MRTIELTVPDNWHCHPRQGMMRLWMTRMLIESGFRGRVLEMPNIKPNPLLTGRDALLYELEGLALLVKYPGNLQFRQVLTIQITEKTTPDIIEEACRSGIRVAKVYPRNVTTNSENGVREYTNIFPALREAEKSGMIVCFHGEHPSYNIEGLRKEEVFIDTLRMIRRNFISLKLVVEHISTRAMVNWVAQQDPMCVRATIAPQYLALTLDDIIGYSERSGCLVRVHNACKPMPKFSEDRFMIRRAAISGDPHFFYGGDDAAHSRGAKECVGGACGVFNTTVALPFLIKLFDSCNALDKLESFLSHYGADFYGYPRLNKKIRFEERPWIVPSEYSVDETGDVVVPLFAGEEMQWRIVS